MKINQNLKNNFQFFVLPQNTMHSWNWWSRLIFHLLSNNFQILTYAFLFFMTINNVLLGISSFLGILCNLALCAYVVCTYEIKWKNRVSKNGILLPSLRKNCSSDQEKLLKFEAEGWEFAKNLRSLEQFIRKVLRGQNYFWNRMLFLTYSLRFLRFNTLE